MRSALGRLRGVARKARIVAADWSIDSISGAPLPVLFVRGWSTTRDHLDIALEYADGTRVAPSLLCREPRADVVQAKGLDFPLPGFVAEYRLTGTPKCVHAFGKRFAVSHAHRYATADVPYGKLIDTDAVLHRGDIYGYGPPVPANPVIVELSRFLLGASILDFGCGTGDLAAKLRAAGRDAVGIEIDRPDIRPDIRRHLVASAQAFVTLYDGSLPLPYADRAFDSAIATEVIEHVGDPHAVAQELMRVARTSILITVPDMASIPFASPTHMVPWHLLESTHVNFFNAESLTSLFAPDFVPAERARLHNQMIGGHFVPGSICVLFRRAGA